MSLFIEPKNIQMKLGKLGDDLDSSSNAGTIQSNVISEFGNKTFKTSKRNWEMLFKTVMTENEKKDN